MNSLHLPVITVSEQKTFHRCPREHMYAYRLGVRPLPVLDPLRGSALVHAGLAAWWQSAQQNLPREEWLRAAHARIATFQEDPFDHVRAEELLTGYHARWTDPTLNLLGVQVTFDMPLLNPGTGAASRTYRVGGTIAALIRTTDGTVYVVEHKTSSEDIAPGSDYWRLLRLDSKVSTLFAGARSLGYEVAGALYDVVGRVRLQPYEATAPEARKYKKDGTLYANQRDEPETIEEFRLRVREHVAAHPERYFVRGVAVRTEEDDHDAAFDLWQTARAIADAERMQRFPRNDQACMRWGRRCPYFGVCSREASIDDVTLYRRTDGAPDAHGGEAA